MQHIVLVLLMYGLASVLPIALALMPSLSSGVFGLPLRAEALLDLALTPWIGVGTFALLYVLIPAASSKPHLSRNRFRVLYFIFAVLYIEGHGNHLGANAISHYPLKPRHPLKVLRSFFMMKSLAMPYGTLEPWVWRSLPSITRHFCLPGMRLLNISTSPSD